MTEPLAEPPEMFDLYDEQGSPLGMARARDEVHRGGDWHRSANIWVFTSDRKLLFQRRAPDKDTWPGKLDASVGGHYRAGEGAEGIAREASEELGITVDPAELIPLGVRKVVSIEPRIVDRELQDVFLLRRDLPLDAYVMDAAEIDALVLLDADDAAALHAGSSGAVRGPFLARGSTIAEERTFTANDLIPERGPYLAVVAGAVDDVLAGRPPRRL